MESPLVSGFFEPPPPPRWPEPAKGGTVPAWAGRPHGAPLGEVLSDLLLARSESGAVYVAYLDAYPDGFEVEVSATTTVGYQEFARDGDASRPDLFGRHWPMVGERRDTLPPELLRVGVRFADGRTATNVSGHDSPAGGPVMWSLRGGGRGGAGGSSFHQGYWISPLPPPGPVEIVCEWPAVGIPLARHTLDAQRIRDAAGRARAMFPVGDHVLRDGREWRLGTDADVAWINRATAAGAAITAAIPPSFEAYGALELPRHMEASAMLRHEQAVIDVLTGHTPPQPWWLGYLDTGASDVVFPYAPRTTVYHGYGYVLVQAGPQQASSWRDTRFNWALPDLMFPADRSWLLSTMWDDTWTSIGANEQLISSFLRDPTLGPRTRRTVLGQDATPPRHQAR